MMNGKDLEGTGHGLTARLRKNTKTKSPSGQPMTCPRIKQKYLLNISPQYYCYTIWCRLFWCESSQRNETDNTASDDGHIPCKHMWLNYSHIGIGLGTVH
jgi:hypothetical protein